MTKSAYIQMKEMQGRPIKDNEIPLDVTDLSLDAQLSMTIYNRLGNRIYESVGFTGKDMTILPMLVSYYEIIDVEYLVDFINILDEYNIEKSQKSIKEMMDKVGKK